MKKKLICLFMIFAMLFSNSSVFAVGLEKEAVTQAEQAVLKTAEVVAEDVSKRSEHEKHYLQSDGTFVAVSYNESIHYKDENGKWQDVDNEIKYDSAKGKYKNSTPAFVTEFRSAESKGSLAKISSQGTEISWNLSVNTSLGTVKNAITSKNIEEVPVSAVLKNAEADETDKFALTKAQGGIEYRNVFENAPEVTVNYSVSHNRVEEDLYFNAKTNVTDIKMEMNLGSLTASVNSNGSVSIKDENGNEKYRIGIPYMQDASDNVLYDIEVKAEMNGDKWIITYTPNRSWLTSNERTYPILFDPSITTSEYNSNVQDTYVKQGSTEDESGYRRIYVGVDNDGSLIARSYIKFLSLPEIDATMPIISAELTFSMYVTTVSGKTTGLYKVTSAWDQNTITYANQPTAGRLIDTSDYNGTTNKHVFDLTDYIHDMYEYEAAGTNYGFLFRYVDESLNDIDYNSIYSSNEPNKAYRPALKIVYGYALPENLQTNKEYYFKNSHNTYLTVHNGTDANNVNVYAAPLNNSSSQKFKLVQASNGGYYIQAVCSSNNRVLDIYKNDATGYVESGCNVQIYNPTDPLAQEWFIIGVTSTSFRIVPRTDMSLSLMANSGTGTADGKSITSSGNVYVYTNFLGAGQLWEIIDVETNTAVTCDLKTIANGIYYLNNRSSGKYLQRTGASMYLSEASGLVSSLGNGIKWEVNHVGNGAYTIRVLNDDYGYLYANGSSAFVGAMSGNNFTDAYLWRFINASGEGNVIQNVGTGKYLGNYGAMTTTLPSQTSSSYGQYVWRSANASTSSSFVELNNASMSLMLSKDGTEAVSITPTPSNAKWADASDFTFSISNTQKLSYNSSSGTFSGKGEVGNVSVTATHKPTGKITTFTAYIVEFDEGTYFLQNRKTEKYAQHYSTQIKQATFDGGDDQKWNLTFVGEGYYAIINDDNNYAVTVPSGSETSNNTNLTLTTYSATNNNQKWSITLTNNGSYKIKAKCAANTTNPELVFAVQTGSGDNIQQNDYIGDNDSYKDEWYLTPILCTYSFGMSIQNAYTDDCEMGESGNYASFGVYADNLSSYLRNVMNMKFDYRGVRSWSTDFKNKNLATSTHYYLNMDDVDLMIYTGHGYAKNRNKTEGLFEYNCFHFGTTDSENSHPLGQGNISSSNFTTQDALYMGYGDAITKWLIAYTCNFLNTEQGDPNVLNLLNNGGRLVLGASSKCYIDGEEGKWLGMYLAQGKTFKDAYFGAAEKAHEIPFVALTNRCGIRYSILYYGPDGAGTLNDTILKPVEDVPFTGGKIISKDINADLGIYCY